MKHFLFVQDDNVSLVPPRGLGVCFMPFTSHEIFVLELFFFQDRDLLSSHSLTALSCFTQLNQLNSPESCPAQLGQRPALPKVFFLLEQMGFHTSLCFGLRVRVLRVVCTITFSGRCIFSAFASFASSEILSNV